MSEKRDASSGAELDLTGNKTVFSDNDLAGINSLQDALDALAGIGATVDNFSEYGNGFPILKDKATLTGKPFVILSWKFHEGTYGTFVSAIVVSESGDKCVLNDGSTGIKDQLEMVTASRVRNGVANTQSGLIVRNGLRSSEYSYSDADGRQIPAVTWYLAE